MRRQAAAVAVAALAVASLTACAESAQAKTCTHLDGAQSAVENLRNVNLSENGMVALQSGLADVKSELQLLKGDVAANVQPQVDAVYTSVQQLESATTAARLDPTSGALDAVGTGLQGVRAAVKDLRTVAASPC